MRPPLPTRDGSRHPPGAMLSADGVNFSIFSPRATRVELLLYEAADSTRPFEVIALDPERNRTHLSWHVFVEGLAPGTHYSWRLDGSADKGAGGACFNPRKELLDPRAHGVTDAVWNRRRAADPADPGVCGLRSVVCDLSFDWSGERAIARDLAGAVIYELHVSGFTRHPSAVVAAPGTFSALTEKIPYLQQLGITHVELLPVMAFDEQSVPPTVAARGLRNYWGYNTHSFWSPHPRYCAAPQQGRAATEFKQLVRALHAAGIGVILDVVFNHTAEGGSDGPWINFRGIANEVFYLLDPQDRRRYLDFTGCGNTVNCNHPQVTSFIVQCLEYWVEEMHVDGFRFDLASVFTRGEGGAVLSTPPLPWSIELSRSLEDIALIAEAWDAAGLYQVGAFPGASWAEWNGAYRDAVRRFVRGDGGLVGVLASRIAGSSDLYADDGRLPCDSINFITCHDGFTLADLVSYNGKHNEANGEDNRDGSNDNLSWNCGVEGPTADAAILALRKRQAKNFLAVLMLSRGVPMLCAGDELLRTQGGNNNTYCQDNELSWFDWSRLESQREMLDFTRAMIAFRRRHASLTVNRFYHGRIVPERGIPDIAWHGARLHQPLWGDPTARVLAFTIAGVGQGEADVHAILNMSEVVIEAEMPELRDRGWHVAVDTAQAPPRDILEPARQASVSTRTHRVAPRSVVVLEARAPRDPQTPGPAGLEGAR
ncbi:MAG TPA: glycogen debranching protein GlgX [Steroidobacteraceae bacterium]|nr:glycogen debranching protein GlgX [Steroidobacteraceae bacterium]